MLTFQSGRLESTVCTDHNLSCGEKGIVVAPQLLFPQECDPFLDDLPNVDLLRSSDRVCA